MNDNLAKLFNSNQRHNNTLIELTETQHKRLSDNCVHLSRLRSNDKKLFYDMVSYGPKLSTTSKKDSCYGCKKNIRLNLSKTKGRFIMITANKEDILSSFPNTYTFSDVMSYKSGKMPPMSGIVILMMGIMRNTSDEIAWDHELHKVVHCCKTNSLKSYSHFNTKGYVYSFGNKPLYGMKDGSSVSTYSNKKNNQKKTRRL